MQLKLNFQQHIFNLSLCSKRYFKRYFEIHVAFDFKIQVSTEGRVERDSEEEESEIEKKREGRERGRKERREGEGELEENQVEVERMIKDKEHNRVGEMTG